LDGDQSTVEKLATDTYVLHPEYNPDTYENDIGLIKLRMPVTLTSKLIIIILHLYIFFVAYIKRLHLPYAELADTAKGIAYGWGQTSDSKLLSSYKMKMNYVKQFFYLTGDSELADTLNYVTLSAVSDAECRLTYGSQIRPNMVCFEGNYNEGTCFVSSGAF
jgi:hypothetical protein